MKEYIKIKLLVLVILVSSLLTSIKAQNNISVIRYDTIFQKYNEVIPKYNELNNFTSLLVHSVLKLKVNSNSIGQEVKALKHFYNAYTSLQNLYNDTEYLFNTKYKASLDSSIIITKYALGRLVDLEPRIKPVKRIFLFVSALHENIVVYSDNIGIALDRYLGVDYPMYPNAMTKWKCQFADIHRVPIDAVKGYLIANIPIETSRLITIQDLFEYWGYIYSVLQKVFPEYSEQELFGFTNSQYKWIKSNVERLYKNAINKDDTHSYRSNVISKYFNELPENKILPKDAPRLVGYYLSYWIFKNNKQK